MVWIERGVTALALAVAAVALVLVIGAPTDRDLERQADELRAEISDLERAQRELLVAAEQGEEESDFNPEALARSVRRGAERIGKLEDCLPEVQAQLNNMEVSGGYTYTNSQVSSYCSGVVYSSRE